MTGTRRAGGRSPEESGEPGWETRLVQKIEDMERRVRRLQEKWTETFGPEPFRNPRFASAYLGLLRGQSVIKILKSVYARDKIEEELSAAAFEAHLEKSVRALEEPAADPDLLPLSFFYYFDLLLEEARAVQGQHRLAYPEPLQQLLTFGRRLREHPALASFRVDPTRGDAASPASGAEMLSELPKGFVLGQVEITRRIGAGRFSQVYEAFHPGLQERRTAKLFRKQDLLGDLGDLRNSFAAEVQAQQALKHPNIVRLLDVDDQPGYLVLFQELVDGTNLRHLIEERKSERRHVSPPEILDLMIPVAKGLEHAHAQGVLHRDLKPENILLARNGAVRITDFGVAKALNDSAQKSSTRLRNLVGTAHYMAPEQISEEHSDHRIDLYALGAVMYHLAWGDPLFNLKDPWKVLQMQRDRTPIPLSIAVAAFPDELNRIVLKLLEKRPADRYASATDLIRDLDACRAGMGGTGSRPRRRRGTRVAWVATALLVILATLVGIWFRTQRQREAAQRDPSPHKVSEPLLPAPDSGSKSPPEKGKPTEPTKGGTPDPRNP